MKIYLSALVFALFAASGAAGDDRGVLIVNPNEQMGPSENASFEMVYDPRLVADAEPIDMQYVDLLAESHEMRNDEDRLKKEIVIPTSVEDPALLANLKDLSPEDRASFLGKKKKYLELVARIYKFFHLPKKFINKRVRFHNRLLFEKAQIVADANSQAVTVSLGAAVGAGVTNKIFKPLENTKLYNHIPENLGFYYYFSFGLAFVRTHIDGVDTYSIRPVFEYRRGVKISGLFAFVAGGLSVSPTFENLKVSEFFQATNFYKVSIATLFSNKSMFGFSIPFSAVFPPMGGIAAAMTGDLYRFKGDLPTLKILAGKLIGFLGFKNSAYLCAGSFN